MDKKEIDKLINDGIDLFESKKYTEAIGVFQQVLGQEINDEEQQPFVLFWLGLCYFEQKDFSKATEIFDKQLNLAEQENDVGEQLIALYGLGRCCFEQKDFSESVEFFDRRLILAEEQQNIEEQLRSRYWLEHCYFFIEGEKVTEQRKNNYNEIEGLFNKLEQRSRKSWEKPIGQLSFVYEKYEEYFEIKKKSIFNNLFEQNSENRELEEQIATILAVLNIHPIELDNTPLAHYTNPSVCEKLFGLNGEKQSDMRMGSSTYMNDPTEGNVLLELLNQQDLELDNKRELSLYNAFFACFSTRVNDLNQFRLYGKEDGVEASGCCLVFNKKGNWLQDTDIVSSYRPFVNGGKELSISDDEIKSNDSLKLPLYQVAYVAYLDEYIKEGKCDIKLPIENPKFGLLLNNISNNEEWHEVRKKKLEEALINLMKYFKVESVSEEDRNKLEYIRYLFKDFAFRDEEEFRLMQIEKMDSNKITDCKESNSIYVPYSDITNMVDEVILGTNYEKTNQKRKVEIFRYQMKDFTHIQISHSSLPINANLPYRKE
ncbi:tetratricopeptide repeat protein [Capnocytophaga canimorsus]|uniref:tetratricopeptide repeat protein n=1 Tax=Capnocytophaga canimorsus TaxID=28188 RepID=UPI000D6E1F42|nr:tetratricopeptide repeat protein [Capnocytophaga canimorsus]AWL78881.1 UDP-N-acetylglucosamine-peptide N-acetylglucosaminyltransferase [Capnocytophaga canimorsus]AYW37486.1 tetratricopeptide repeat protein [Capnocytophaga canimorsus]MDT9500277.1 tetratricopeptide repeat protein [Capnocytophaga canimorsus]